MAEIFRPGGTPPAWCEFKGFEPLVFDDAIPMRFRRQAARERLVVTASAVQVEFGGEARCCRRGNFLICRKS